jgi:hypothetical protein
MMKRSWVWIASVAGITVLVACKGTGARDGTAPEPAPRPAALIHDAARGKPVTLLGPPSSQYSAEGAKSLVDGKMGSWDYLDMQWMGWWYEEKAFVATIDLGQPVAIQELSVHALTTSEAWIFYPRKVDFAVSSDGRTYTKVATVKTSKADLETEDPEDRFLKATGLTATGRYVRVSAERYGELPDWHQGHGGADGYEGQAWLFIDEVLVNPK